SDQGWQYQMRYYQNELKKNGIIQSMSRKGNCLDNSIIENFFSILKTEMFYKNQKYFNSLEELELAIIEYIDYYNNRRIKAKLKGMSPYNFRQHSLEYI
ncbi:putative transposase, partial [Mycoplasma testudineum]